MSIFGVRAIRLDFLMTLFFREKTKSIESSNIRSKDRFVLWFLFGYLNIRSFYFNLKIIQMFLFLVERRNCNLERERERER